MAITVEKSRGTATVPVATADAFLNIVRTEKLKSDIQQIRSLKARAAACEQIGKTEDAAKAKREMQKIKSGLPGFIFQCKASLDGSAKRENVETMFRTVREYGKY